MWTRFLQAVQNYLTQHVGFATTTVVERLLEIVVLFILARICIRVLLRMAHRFLHSRAMKMDARRRNTLESLLDNVIRYTVYFLYVLMLLQSLNFHIETLLAGAGIAGLAVGFGAQSLIKDLLTGMFILFEDQYGVGDSVKINNFTGTVKSIGLRLTKIQAWTGELEIIPNGQITQVTNYSKYNSLAVVDIGIDYHTNIDEAMRILETVMERVKQEAPQIIGEVQFLGVQSLGQSNIVLRVTAECEATTHFGVQRLAQRRIKEAFDEAGIHHPFPTNLVLMQPDSKGGSA